MHAASDSAIIGVAERQYGIVSRSQLAAAGLGRGAIQRRVAAGRLHRLHRGVYAVGHRALSREARWLAAVMACGHGALLSHRSAAALWGLRNGEGRNADVSVPTRGGRGHSHITVHRTVFATGDVRMHRGIPVTSPARTLVDLAFVLDADDLERVVREAQFQRRFDLVAVRAALARRPSVRLSALLENLAPTQSRSEDAVLRLCRKYGLPRPDTQQPVGGRRVDFLWRDERVVVEADTWEAHGTPSAFQSDRAATNQLQLRGYVALRFTKADIRRRPAHVAHQIRAALARRAGAAG